eukprot:scaffold9172_cov128-Cylindrotheca_fusiformis.AAC.1
MFVRLLSLLLLLSFSAHGQECTSNGACDTHERCPVWKEEGECEDSKTYMSRYCPASCGVTETLEEEKLRILSESEAFGTRQEAIGSSREQTLATIRASIQYMKGPEASSVQGNNSCQNQHKHCSFWTTIGNVTCLS